MTDEADRAGGRRHRRGGAGTRANTVVAVSCAALVATMVGAAFAAVPLYDLLCRVTGFGGTPQVVEAAPLEVADRDIVVRFDANIAPALPWRFRPVDRAVTLKLGEVAEVFYEIESLSDEVTWGTAAFNVTPELSGAYFSKINCFCFTAQKLDPHERLEVPVVFYVDPALADNRSTESIGSITLSYTFFPTGAPAAAAAPAGTAGTAEVTEAVLADDG